jgi:hypothetical protein
MTPQQFIEELKETFYHKNKLLRFSLSQQNTIFDTIKAFLQKKNLVVVSKVEYEKLLEFEEKQHLEDLAEQKDFY